MAKMITNFRIACPDYSAIEEKPAFVHITYQVYDDVAETYEWKGLEYDSSIETPMTAFYAAMKTAAEIAEGIS